MLTSDAMFASNGNSPKTRPKRSTAYNQAVHLQDLMLKDADIPDLKPLIRCGIARAFAELEETKRRLKMRPLPKNIDVTKTTKAKKRAASPGFSEHPATDHTTGSTPPQPQ